MCGRQALRQQGGSREGGGVQEPWCVWEAKARQDEMKKWQWRIWRAEDEKLDSRRHDVANASGLNGGLAEPSLIASMKHVHLFEFRTRLQLSSLHFSQN